MNLDITTIETVLLGLLVLDALALAVLILMQQGRGADVGAAFGSGSANTMFGAGGGASFMNRATAWLAIGFFLIAFGLAFTAKEKAGSLSRVGLPDVPVIEDSSVELPDDSDLELTPGPEDAESDLPDI